MNAFLVGEGSLYLCCVLAFFFDDLLSPYKGGFGIGPAGSCLNVFGQGGCRFVSFKVGGDGLVFNQQGFVVGVEQQTVGFKIMVNLGEVGGLHEASLTIVF